MKRVVISSNVLSLKHFFEKDNDAYHYIMLDNDTNLESLLFVNGCKKIEIIEIGFDFAKEYIEFIGRLNVDYNSLCWWANSISSKNPFISQLIPDIYNYYLIISTLKRKDVNNVIIISSNHVLNNCIKLFCERNLFYCKILNKRQGILFEYFKHAGEIFISSTCFVLKGWWKKYLATKHFEKRIKNDIVGANSFYVLRTWLDSRSFPSHNEYKDAYFGILPQYLTKNGAKLIILCGILKNFNDIVGKISNYNELLIVPQEYFISYYDYIRILKLAYLHKVKIKDKILFKDEDVTSLIEAQLKIESNELKSNLQYYYYVKGLLNQINVKTFTYTFENHSWEKLSILALKKYSPDTKIIGYQHAQVSKHLYNYFPGKAELNVIPLPDKIITVGKETKNILNTYGNYKQGMIKEGCALRHQYLYEIDTLKRNKRCNLLVSLGMLDDSVKLIKFLYKSLRHVTKYNLILRCHPIVNFEHIKKRLYFNLDEKFSLSSIANVAEDLKRADILIYTSTTVCIEALMMGIPVIHIDLNEPISVDPLFNIDYFKWVATREEELPMIIEQIYALSDSEFFELGGKAKKAIQNYLCTVDENKLKEFIV